VIIETRKREREKRIERAMRTSDDDDNEDGDQEENEEKHKQRRIKKKGMSYFSLTANQLHDTTHKRNGETAALSIHRIAFVCVLGCEVVCEPTNRKKSFVKRRRERKRTTNEQ
jgi:hypothetical protein